MSGCFNLAGKVIIVTGAGSGIGQGIARGLSAMGARVHGFDINAEGLKRRGFTPEAINAIKQAYRAVYKAGLSMDEARAKLDEIQKTAPEVAVLNDFLASSQRGIIR